MTHLFVIYTSKPGTARPKLCCYVHDAETAMDACEEYAEAVAAGMRDRLEHEGIPLWADDNTRDDIPVIYDVEGFPVIKLGPKVLQRFYWGSCNLYVEDFLDQRTEAVKTLQNDDITAPHELIPAAHSE